MRTPRRRGLALAMTGAYLPAVTAAQAAGTPEQQCQNGRYDAVAKYSACQQKTLGKFEGGDYTKLPGAASKCRVKYAGTWAMLQAKASGTGVTCDHDRFATLSALGTVIERLTGLQWAQPTDDGTLRDKDNVYPWSTVDGDTTDADGPVVTIFLLPLSNGGFAGHSDWRLPTIAELQTILLEPYPCTTRPCIDQAVFGPATAAYFWSATTSASDPTHAWVVTFSEGYMIDNFKGSTDYHVRAVRAGV